jgi:hypothetical protein
MKFIFFSFKHRHRKKDLNNFLKTRFFKDFFIIDLSGPINSYLAKILIFLKIGKAISCDGQPLISDKKSGINFWVRGTNLDIPENYRNKDNNYSTIYNPILKKENNNVFQLYPIDIIKSKINIHPKLIYMSKTLNKDHLKKQRGLLFDGQPHGYEKDYEMWINLKSEILNDFSLIDNISFWNKNFAPDSDYKYLQIYINFKTFLRHEIILNIKSRFKDNFLLVGDDWIEYFDDAIKSSYSKENIRKLYNGNICLDLGSILGSISLYSRSNQIIESGGLLIQSKQIDSNKIWGPLSKDFLFNDLNALIELVQKLLNDNAFSGELLSKINSHFDNGKENMNKILNNIF